MIKRSGAARFAMGISVLLALALLVVAASDSRSVRGTVSDRDGKPVSGAVVKLKDMRTLRIRSYITREDGVYQFHGLSANSDYELKAQFKGASSDSKTVSQFNTDQVITVNLKIG